jgi:hypothetical protein
MKKNKNSGRRKKKKKVTEFFPVLYFKEVARRVLRM